MAETINMRPEPEGDGWGMSDVEKKGAEVMSYEEQRRRERTGETIDMAQDPETGEWTLKDESFWDFFTDFFEQKGEEVEREEVEQEKGLVRWEPKRERTAASGALATFGQVAGVGAVGGLWTLGQILKYSLLGWTLDANGVPRKDSAALAQFEKTYKATKDQGIIGGITEGIAA